MNKKNIFITGGKGFLGKNLIVALRRREELNVMEYDLDSPPSLLVEGLAKADMVFHLAGVNRPERVTEFQEGNVALTANICDILRRRDSAPYLLLSSSYKAVLDSPYGLSKRQAEDIVFEFGRETGASVFVFRLPGVFGKWCRPNYNSVVATFCHNIARDLPIQISNPSKEIEIVHVDDVLASFISLLEGNDQVRGAEFLEVEPVFKVMLGGLAEKLRSFHSCLKTLVQPDLTAPLDRRLFGTYMSYLPGNFLAYRLPQKEDNRGAFAEFLKLNGHGQIFVSRTKPGITRGNHYHDLKVEKFLVMEGDAIIRFRHMNTGEITEYTVSGHEIRVVDVPPGYTHSIENVGTGELIVLFWSSEVFDPLRPDTHPAEVNA